MASLTQEQINWLDKCTTINGIKGSWTLNPKTGLVDVDGRFNCSKQGLSDFKGVKFGSVGKYFSCSENQLTSLEGAPQSVGEKSRGGGDGHFNCSYNRLTSLVGAPQKVKGHFWCCNNRLTSLVGAPQRVERDFYCENNRLISIEGAPQMFMSLNGIPQTYYYYDGPDGNFYCKGNPVSQKTLYAISSKMKECHSFVIAAASLRNEMSKKDYKLISNSLSKKGITEDKIQAIISWYSIRNMI
jgi:hypothetical protein